MPVRATTARKRSMRGAGRGLDMLAFQTGRKRDAPAEESMPSRHGNSSVEALDCHVVTTIHSFGRRAKAQESVRIGIPRSSAMAFKPPRLPSQASYSLKARA